jgi:hypothetical protein
LRQGAPDAIQHRTAPCEADRKHDLVADGRIRNEAVAIEVGLLPEEVDGGEDQPWDRRLLQRDGPLVGNAEGPRPLVSVIEPAELFPAHILFEPDGFLRLRILRELDVKIIPELRDVVLEGGVDGADHQCRDHNCCNRPAPHGLPLFQLRRRRAHYSSCCQNRQEGVQLWRAIKYLSSL